MTRSRTLVQLCKIGAPICSSKSYSMFFSTCTSIRLYPIYVRRVRWNGTNGVTLFTFVSFHSGTQISDQQKDLWTDVVSSDDDMPLSEGKIRELSIYLNEDPHAAYNSCSNYQCDILDEVFDGCLVLCCRRWNELYRFRAERSTAGRRRLAHAGIQSTHYRFGAGHQHVTGTI